MRWLAHVFGLDSATGEAYLFWSGAGGLLVVWAGSLLLVWWRTSCKAERRCLRHAGHEITDPATGVTHRVCWKHAGAPRRYLTAARITEIRQRAHLYVGERPGRG